MKRFLYTLILSSAIGLQASAVTVDDLMKWGGWVIETTTDADYAYNSYWASGTYYSAEGPVIYGSSGETRFERIDDKHIRLTGMFDDELNLIFTLANNGVESADGNQLIAKSGSRLTPSGTSSSSGHTIYYAQNDGNHDYDYDSYLTTYWRGDIVQTSTGYKITFGPLVTSPSLFSTNYTMGAIEKYELEVYEPNAVVSQQDYDWYSHATLKDSHVYPARIEFDDNGNFTFLNFNDCGYAIPTKNSTALIKGKVYDNGDMLINADQVFTWSAERIRENSYEDYPYDPQNWAPYTYKQIWDVETDNIDYGYVIADNDDIGINSAWGQFGIHHFSTREYDWITNDGDCYTFDDIQMVIADFVGVNEDNSIAVSKYGGVYFTPVARDTYVNIENDCTLDVDLVIDSYGYEYPNPENPRDGTLSITGHVTSKKNFDNVDHYEIFLVGGDRFYSSVNHHEGFKRVNDTAGNGHANGIKIYAENYSHFKAPARDTDAATRANAAASPKDYSFSVKIPMSEVGYSPYFTTYIKAHYNYTNPYNNNQLLEATFHDMTPVNDVVLGLENVIDSDAAVDIRVEGRTISADGARSMEIYTAGGAAVYTGSAEGVEVAPGIYIVRAGTTVKKVAVR